MNRLLVILGISAFYHDAAAALVVDGRVVAAAQEERFSRIKHDASFPHRAIAYCLDAADIQLEQVQHVVFYEKPFLKLERILESYLANAPHGFDSFRHAIPVWLKEKLYQSRQIRRGLDNRFERKLIFVQHHESHAASAFYPSPFSQAAILTVDGVGEWATTMLGVGNQNKVDLQQEVRFPHSLGLLYSAFTAYCGFRVNGGEGKLMGLAPYGKACFRDLILEQLLDLKEDGSYRLNLDYFDPVARHTFFNQRFCELLGGPARGENDSLTQRHQDVAASIQAVTEEVLLRMANHLHQHTGLDDLCLAGGVALNCVANGRIVRESPFERVWIQPAAGDAGAAVGAALLVWHQLLGRPRETSDFNPFLGPCVNSSKIDSELATRSDWQIRKFADRSQLACEVAQLLANEKVIGVAQGRMEFGPRALGNRSILADPRQRLTWDRLNKQVKLRESFRPFAPAILASRAHEYFESDVESPFMLLTVPAIQAEASEQFLGATTHVDGSSRLQTVAIETMKGQGDLPLFLEAFEELTGCPALLNTSFNVRGQPMVCTETDAILAFENMKLDALVLDDILIERPTENDSDELERGRSIQQETPVSLVKRIGRFWHWLTFPIRWLVSNVALAILFFAVFAPVGWWWRRRRQSFLTIDAEEPTYWVPCETGRTPESYFRQS